MGAITGLYVWGTNIGEILQDWEYWGVFEYILPGLLIFAIVFGILMRSRILGEEAKGVNTVVSLAVALLAMQSFALREFFRTIFPFAGIGIAILLVGLILTGLFHSDTDWWNYTFFGIGMLIAIIVVMSSLATYQWAGGWWWQENWSAIVTLLIIIGLVALVILATKSPRGTKTP